MKKKCAFILVVILCFSLLSGCGTENEVTIASKQYTESLLIAEMYAQLIEAKTDIKVIRKLNLGGTTVCMSALNEGKIDICPMYTGTLYNEVLSHELDGSITTEEIRDICHQELDSRLGLTMSEPQGHNNTYALAIKSERVSELGTKISDLSSLSKDLSFGANHIFYTRVHDGYDGLTATYDLDFKEALKMDSSLLYEAVDNGDLDVIIVFSTDSLLRKFDLTCLEDDRALFPPYEGVAVCRNEAIEKHPELKEILNMLTYAFDDNIIQDLNYQVDIEKRSIEEVAAEFLKDNGYLD